MRIDSGWMYVIGGLALCVCGILVPAQAELAQMRRQVERLEAARGVSNARIQTRAEFLEALRLNDPALMRRLAAAQLNLVPEEQTPVLLANSRDAGISEWIDQSVAMLPAAPVTRRTTWLDRLTGSRYRLWLLGGGVLLVFLGLMPDCRRAQPQPKVRPLPLPGWQPPPIRPQWRLRPRSVLAVVE